MTKTLTIEIEREADGRWIAEIPALPGVMVYGETRRQALIAVESLALRVLGEKLTAPLGTVRFKAKAA